MATTVPWLSPPPLPAADTAPADLRACWWLAPGGDLHSIQRGVLSRGPGSSPLPALASAWKCQCHLRPRSLKATWSLPPTVCPLLGCFDPCPGARDLEPQYHGSSCSCGPICLPPMVTLSVHPYTHTDTHRLTLSFRLLVSRTVCAHCSGCCCQRPPTPTPSSSFSHTGSHR